MRRVYLSFRDRKEENEETILNDNIALNIRVRYGGTFFSRVRLKIPYEMEWEE